jgi:ATP-dependent Clp protease adaptor protein ClpS
MVLPQIIGNCGAAVLSYVGQRPPTAGGNAVNRLERTIWQHALPVIMMSGKGFRLQQTTLRPAMRVPDPTSPDRPAFQAASRLRVRMGDDERRKGGDRGNLPGTAVISKTKPQTKRPSLYRVLILNDDYTPMEFVVHVLERFFNKDREAATRIMLHVHNHGIGECGIYTYEVAETKVTQVMDFARKHQHPLQCVMEKK